MITEMYILLGGKAFLAANSEALCKILHLTVTKVRPRGVKYIGLVLEALLRECALEGGLLLFHWGILETMLRSCALNCANVRECEPDRVIILYLNALARVSIASPDILDSLLPLSTCGISFGYSELVRASLLSP